MSFEALTRKMVATTCNVFVGSETGLLKGVDTSQRSFQNLNDIKHVVKAEDEIEIMCWADQNPHTQVCSGLKSRLVKLYDTNSGVYETVLTVDGGRGSIKGLATHNGNYLTCVESGVVKVWSKDKAEETMELNVGENVCRMRHNAYQTSQIVTGGKENELKLWDLENSKQPIFKAKNVKRDFLDLRVPVWITDMQFLSEGQQIVTATGYHQIRLYDTKSSQKRPVIDMEFDEFPLTSLAVAHQQHYVIAGNTHGRMALFDLRKKLMVHCYKGFAGSIRSIQCHPTAPQVASCGLDRFLRIHDIHTHKLLQKIYLKSRLNCLLLRDDVTEQQVSSKDGQSTDAVVRGADEVNDDLWNNMEEASDDEQSQLKGQRRKRLAQSSKKSVKIRRKSKIES